MGSTKFRHVSARSLEETTARIFESLRPSPPELRDFLYKMPKGADLHTHLLGDNYAESLINIAANDGLCVDKRTFTILPAASPCAGHSVSAKDTLTDPNLNGALIDALSMRGFVPSPGITGHDHFFSIFDRLQNIDVSRHLAPLIDEVVTRAGSQNEQYVEVMHTPDFKLAAQLGRSLPWTGNLAATRDTLLARGLRQNVETDRREIDRAEAERSRMDACSASLSSAACRVTLRYLFQVLRGFPPQQVFAQALLGFELASVDPRVVGINFVMPEDWNIPMTEYHRQMAMLDYLHSIYPSVHISLHAGELAFGIVPPDGLTFHIREAIELGHAERIGHGVSIMYEEHAQDLLRIMASRQIAVEVNLTSNDLILGVRGSEHPLPIYREAGVPVALCTDDEGVSRIDLTHEYERATREFNLNYRDLKQLARTSIKYCFLPAKERAAQLSQLAERFDAFESAITSTDTAPRWRNARVGTKQDSP